MTQAERQGEPRVWMNLLIQDHLVGKEFDIPPAVAKMLWRHGILNPNRIEGAGRFLLKAWPVR